MKLVTISGLLVKSYNALASGTMNDWYLSCMIESSVRSVSDCRTGDQKHFANSIVPKAAEAAFDSRCRLLRETLHRRKDFQKTTACQTLRRSPQGTDRQQSNSLRASFVDIVPRRSVVVRCLCTACPVRKCSLLELFAHV